jgi:thiol-disulfide isomerase/thioredoxin
MFLVALLLFAKWNVLQAQSYNFKVKIKNSEDTVLYLANYFGDKTYLTDTATISRNGDFIFSGDTLLPSGIYIIANQSNNRYFELIVNDSQEFEIETDMADINVNMRVKNSPENQMFFDYVNFNIANYRVINALRKKKEDYKHISDSVEVLQHQIDSVNNALGTYKQDIIDHYPKSFISVIFKAMKEPEPDAVPILSNGRKDSIYAYQYYKNHYWDEIDLSDERLLRTPVFNSKIEKFFTKVIYQIPDTIVKEADLFIEKTRANKEVFKYVVWYLTFKYETSKIMGFDEIFVHMVDNYYANGEAYWADSTVVKSISEQADGLRRILIGEKAPELILIDTSASFVSLHHIDAPYLILLFYEADCGHCKIEIDALLKAKKESIIKFEVFAVCTDTSMVKWKNLIHSKKMDWINVNGTRSIQGNYHDLYNISMTPTLFLLDDSKNIIAKRLKTDQLIPFLENYEKRKLKEGLKEADK